MLCRSTLILIAIIFTACSKQLEPSTEDQIDLAHAKLNGRDLFSLSLDELTDLFGKPTFLEPEYGIFVEAQRKLFAGYLDKGLKFAFQPKPEQTNKVCIALEVFLSKSDAQPNGQWQPCSVKLPKNLNSNWKIARVLTEFTELKLMNMATNSGALTEVEEQLAKTKLFYSNEVANNGFNEATATRNERQAEDYLKQQLHTLRSPEGHLIFYYQPETKFIERIVLQRAK